MPPTHQAGVCDTVMKVLKNNDIVYFDYEVFPLIQLFWKYYIRR